MSESQEPILYILLIYANNSPLAHRPAQGRAGGVAGNEAAVAGLLLQRPLVQEHLAAQQGHVGAALHLPALEEGVAGVAVVVPGGDDAVAARVENQQIGVGTNLDYALAGVEAKNTGRVLGHDPGQPPDGQASLHHALAVHQGTRVSTPGDPKGTEAPLGSTKMLSQPTCFNSWGYGAWSLAVMEM